MTTRHHDLPDPNHIIAEKVLDHKFYTEGPAIDSEGRLYFTDLAGRHIQYLQQQQASAWARGLRPNGQAILGDGSHLVCDSEAACIFHFDAVGKKLGELSKGHIDGMPVRCPNDIAVDSGHGYYFTDSVRHDGAVFYAGFDGSQRIVAKDIDFANGIVLTADQKFLLIAESYKNRILKIELTGPGQSKGSARIFADLPVHPDGGLTANLPDGLAIDKAGRLWVAHYGMQALQVLSPSGELLASYDTQIPLTSNLCFKGPYIYVTGGLAEPGPGLVTRLKTGIEGLPLY